MKLWILVGALGLMAAPNAFALDTLTDPAETSDDAPVAHVENTGADLKRKCGAPKHETQSRQQRETTASAAAPPPQRPRRPDQQRSEQATVDPPVTEREMDRRRRNGALESIPDSLLLGGHGAL